VVNARPSLVLWTNRTLSLCLLCFATLVATVMTASCEINLLHFGRRPKGGGGWPNGKYAHADMVI